MVYFIIIMSLMCYGHLEDGKIRCQWKKVKVCQSDILDGSWKMIGVW
jgi:hypothetical protein